MVNNINESGAVSKETKIITACGAGNASHSCVSDFSSNGFIVNVLLHFNMNLNVGMRQLQKLVVT
jgi:hypothetical protein